MSDLLKKLAELEHEQWCSQTGYVINNLTPENIEKWKRQVNTHYTELSEKEKNSDRVWADKVLNLLHERKGGLDLLINNQVKIVEELQNHILKGGDASQDLLRNIEALNKLIDSWNSTF